MARQSREVKLGFILVIVLSICFVLSIGIVSAAWTAHTFEKKGNEAVLVGGSMAVAGNCGGICSWIAGDQVIVGAKDSNYNNWGGVVEYDFDLSSINISNVKSLQ